MVLLGLPIFQQLRVWAYILEEKIRESKTGSPFFED
jgi:hypothetical protein